MLECFAAAHACIREGQGNFFQNYLPKICFIIILIPKLSSSLSNLRENVRGLFWYLMFHMVALALPSSCLWMILFGPPAHPCRCFQSPHHAGSFLWGSSVWNWKMNHTWLNYCCKFKNLFWQQLIKWFFHKKILLWKWGELWLHCRGAVPKWQMPMGSG